MAATSEKFCKRCETTKTTDLFYRSSRGYLSTLCKQCEIEKRAQYVRDHPDRVRSARTLYSRKYRAATRGSAPYRARQILDGMVKRSRERGWPTPQFTLAEILTEIDGGVCAKTGIPFVFEAGGHGEQNPWTAVPDRIDSSLPYTTDNVQWVCNVYNSAKKAWSDEEVLVMARALLAQHEGTEHADR